jgi:hypothetical protein
MLAALEGLLDLAVLGMAFRGLFGEDEVAVDRHFEHPAPGRDQGQLGDRAGVVRQELGRQTDGPVRVISDHAVFDADLHGSPFQAGQISLSIEPVLSPWYRSSSALLHPDACPVI